MGESTCEDRGQVIAMTEGVIDDIIADADRRASRLPRARRIAAVMLDDPALLHEVIYRQTRSLWAGHVWAVAFWTDTLRAYLNQWPDWPAHRVVQDMPQREHYTAAYEAFSVTTDRMLPRSMRQRPDSIYLRLPRANPFARLKHTARAKLARADTPWFYMMHALPAFRGYFPPDEAWPLVIREVGYWTALSLKLNDPDATAHLLGMHSFRYRAALATAQRLVDEQDPKNHWLAKGEFRRRVDHHDERLRAAL